MTLTKVTYESNLNDGLAQKYPRLTKYATVPQGNQISRFTVLGRITANGNVIESDSGAGDGSEAIYAVAAQDVDTTVDGTNADTLIAIYMTGAFIEEKMTFGPGHDPATAVTADALRALQIYAIKY